MTFYKNIIFFIILFVLTCINVGVFFYIKNSTHYMSIAVKNLNNEVELERHNLSIQKAEFNKKYNLQYLQELAKNRLNLQFSNVNQIIDLDDIMINETEIN